MLFENAVRALNKTKDMTPKEAIEILENKVAYGINDESLDKDTMLEAVNMAIDALKEKEH